ncbi:substrate-binding domain-containing protein [Cellulomonas sp. 179-A 4D5 NHS]
MAQGALRALAAAGRRMPDDVAVVGFDDSAAAEQARPRLTTVRQPVEQMAAEMAQLLPPRSTRASRSCSRRSSSRRSWCASPPDAPRVQRDRLSADRRWKSAMTWLRSNPTEAPPRPRRPELDRARPSRVSPRAANPMRTTRRLSHELEGS